MNRGQRNDIKSVKVDNWGTFFLQKLQNFFNKTDYCDLTLQFMDNSQLKVHRLVLSACTDYFNMLEQSCEMIEDILIMPNDLQADVIVPIVNFMYTGTLEFQYNMYEKLLKTAREMNMTVLSKLLEAHRQTTVVPKVAQQPVLLNKNAPARRQFNQQQQQQGTKIYGKVSPAKPVVYKQGQTIIKHVGRPQIPDSIQMVTRYQPDGKSSRPSRFNIPDEIVPDAEGTFEDISYESKPLLTASQIKRDDENSPFENLRKGYTNKRMASSCASNAPPPSKRPNLEDVKAEAEAQRQRNELEDDDDDDPDYDADQFFEEVDDDSDEETKGSGNKNQKSSSIIKSTTKQITVNDCSGGNVDHAKILSEVLKKYPHLVKNPKNIKLKIMQKPSSANAHQTTAIVRVMKQEKTQSKPLTSTPTLLMAKKSLTQQSTPPSNLQPKKIDAKTMHELIKMGAENMKGPWLCLRCGVQGRPIKFLLYAHMRAVHRHKAKNDGVMDFSDDEEYVPSGSGKKSDEYSPNLPPTQSNKIKILSNIEIPTTKTLQYTTPSSEAEALTNVASGIAASLGLVDNADNMDTSGYEDQYIEQQLAQVHGEYEKKDDSVGMQSGNDIFTKLIAEDGTELQLTQSQKEEILQQLQSQGANLSDNVVMVLDQAQFIEGGRADIKEESQDGTNGNSNIYSEAHDNTSIDMKTLIKPEELDKVEIVFEAQEATSNDSKEKSQTDEADNKSKLIADLEGDWTEEDESSQPEITDESKSQLTEEDEAEQPLVEGESETDVNQSTVQEVEDQNVKELLDDWNDEDTKKSLEAAQEPEESMKYESQDEENKSKISEIQSQNYVDETEVYDYIEEVEDNNDVAKIEKDTLEEEKCSVNKEDVDEEDLIVVKTEPHNESKISNYKEAETSGNGEDNEVAPHTTITKTEDDTVTKSTVISSLLNEWDDDL
ncbi:unnamed protein product [Diamesa serratosioi]